MWLQCQSSMVRWAAAAALAAAAAAAWAAAVLACRRCCFTPTITITSNNGGIRRLWLCFRRRTLACSHHCFFLYFWGFNAGNCAQHTPVCSSLLLQSTWKVRPYIFIYKHFLQCFQLKHLLDILHWLFYSFSRLAIPVGFYRKTLYLYCFIKKISQASNVFFLQLMSSCRATFLWVVDAVWL